MTLRQYLLKKIYPILIFFGKSVAKTVLKNLQNLKPLKSFYELSIKLNSGETLNFNELKGYKVLIVNTASNCGYTAQYAELEKLYQEYNNKLKIIAFPSNNFKQQEKGTDADIAMFCKKNYGISFYLSQKTDVVGNNRNEVFEWLSNKDKNGWCNQQPQWNFSKYLIDEQGILLAYFTAQISPDSNELVSYLKLDSNENIC